MSLASCFRAIGLTPEDRADIRARVEANGGNEAAGVQSYIDSLNKDLEDARKELASKGFDVQPIPPVYSQTNRGAIAFTDKGAVLYLFEHADLSTVIHEMGHFFLTNFKSDVNRFQDAADVAQFKSLSSWWHDEAATVARMGTSVTGTAITQEDVRRQIETGTTGDAVKDHAIDVGVQEITAKGFEAYALKGESPTVGLRAVFARMKAWMQWVYQSVKNIGVEVNPQLKAVFDRWLATDEELVQALADSGGDMLTFATAEQYGMSQPEFERLQKLHEDARAEAEARLLSSTMEPIVRAQTKEWRAEMKAEVAKEVAGLQTSPLYKAIQEMRFGKTFDGVPVDSMKLNRALVDHRYGAGMADALPRGVAVKGGVDPTVAAEFYGFASADEMIRMLSGAPTLQVAAQANANQTMFRRHGDPLLDGTAAEMATDAIHTNGKRDKRAQYLSAELRALEKLAGRPVGLSWQQAKELATRALQSMAVRNAIRSDRYLNAERKAGHRVAQLAEAYGRQKLQAQQAEAAVKQTTKEALAGGQEAAVAINAVADVSNVAAQKGNVTIDQLLEAKIQQIINHALYAGSRNVRQELETLQNTLGNLARPASQLVKTIDYPYALAARQIASMFGLAREVKAFDFAEWMKQLETDQPLKFAALSDALQVAASQAKPYKDMSAWELGGLHDAIDNLLSQGRYTRGESIDGHTAGRQIAEMTGVLNANVAKRGKIEAKWTGSKVGSGIGAMASALIRMEAYARYLDGGKVGFFTKYLFQPVQAATEIYNDKKAAITQDLHAILERNAPSMLNGVPIEAPELGFTFENKGQLIHALMHFLGNESNQRKLLIGRGWGERQDNGTVDTTQFQGMVDRMVADGTIVESDVRMMQDVFDLLEGTKGDAQRAHYKMKGYYARMVENKPFTMFGKTWKGGYVPARIDYTETGGISPDAQTVIDLEADAYMMPSTEAGFMKERNEKFAKPLELNLMSLVSHLNKVMLYSHVTPAVHQVATLVNSPDMTEAFRKYDPSAIGSLINPWLRRTNLQMYEQPMKTQAGRAFAGVLHGIRRRTGLSIMFLNVVNTLQQFTGIFPAMVLVHPLHLAPQIARMFVSLPTMRSDMRTMSKYMNHFDMQQTMKTARAIEDIMNAPTIGGKFEDFSSKYAYFFQQHTQGLVNVPVWHAAYNQSIAAGMSNEESVLEANSVVRRTQGDFSPQNMAAFESGTAFYRIFTQFSAYFNSQANLLYGEAATGFRTSSWSTAFGRLAMISLFGFMAPALISSVMSDLLRPKKPQQGGLPTSPFEVLTYAFSSLSQYAAPMIPAGGAVMALMLNKFDKVPYNDQLNPAPIISTVQQAASAPAETMAAIQNRQKWPQAIHDMMIAFGLLSGVPMGTFANTGKYIASVQVGRSHPQGLADVIQGVTSGRDTTTR